MVSSVFGVSDLDVVKVDIGCCVCCKPMFQVFQVFRRVFQVFCLEVTYVVMAIHACFKRMFQV